MTATAIQLVAFCLGSQTYALRLESVERIIPAVEVTPLPEAPEAILGVINLQGKIVPVLDVRARFRLPKRQINLSDQLVVASTEMRTVAFIVDSVIGIVKRSPHEITEANLILRGLKYLQGVAKLEDEMMFIHNLDTFLSLDEENQLERAINKR
jgi:purine-binding chemotaxis protein CheW